MASLVVSGVSRTFGQLFAVRDVTLEIATGEFFALLGPSGCGKTTLLRMIAGFEHPDAGTIAVDGEDITRTAPGGRAMGMVFQNYALFPHLSVFENVAFGLRAKKRPGTEIAEAVATALRNVGLEAKKSARVTALSGGEQQRVALARALVLAPRILLCDEPLSNLDVGLRAGMREEIRSLQRQAGVTTLYVTHDQAEAMSLADRIAVMRDGRIEQTGTPAELYDNPATPFVASFFGGANLLEGHVDTGRSRFTSGGLSVPLPKDPGVRGAAILAVKPEAVSVHPPGHSPGFSGVVKACEYLGFYTSFTVRAGEHTIKAVTTDSRGVAGFGVGAEVVLTIDWDRCSWYPGAGS